jgi:general nucleoside transport system ATP-binding protein
MNHRAPSGEPILEARGITKRFPGVLANDHVDLDLYAGEILALLGENGAGKTTLMNVIYGLYHADAGEVRVEGEPVTFANPGDAIERGIGMVHQHFQLVQPMTVTENLILGAEITNRAGLLDLDRARQRVRELSDEHRLAVDPDAITEELPVGLQQRVEILKALYRDARILILDEPTAVLTPQEIRDLFRVMRSLADRGHAIIFITHKLREVFEVASRIVVMRNGRVVGHALPKESTRESLASMMVGRDVILQVPKGKAHPGPVVLHVDGLRAADARGQMTVRGASLHVRSGEILGVAGVQGNGQTELVEAIAGLLRPVGGTVTIDGEDVTDAPPRARTELGVAHIPENRHRHGMVEDDPIRDNLVLDTYYKPPYARFGLRNDQAIEENARRLLDQFSIMAPSIDTKVGALSGGNQQRVVVARELGRPIKLLIAAQPTRGLDVGSIEFIHRRIVEQRDSGVAVLLVSAELDEILSLADRIAVIYEGEIIATVPATEATRERIGLLMAGVREEGAIEVG